MPTLVLLGALLGSAFGAGLPEFAARLSPVGSAYVMALQMVVYPYVVCSLVHGLGRLDRATSKRFFLKAGPFFLLAWGLTLATIAALRLGLPSARVVTLDFTAGPTTTTEGFLKLLIPSNVFADLSSNTVPAVVTFALLFGFAIQSHPKKESLLSLLEVIKSASVIIWNWCVQLSPLAIFAMLASTVGSVSSEQLDQMALYSALFTLGAFAMCFWSLPWVISCFIPLRSARLVKGMRDALVIAAVTTLSVAALPLLGQLLRDLCSELGLEDERRDEILETALAVAYPLGQLGNLFVYLFLLFAAAYYHQPVEGAQATLLPLITLISTVGSPSSTVNAVDFLSGWLSFPEGSPALYVQTMVITRYGQVLVSVMSFAFLTLCPVMAFYGRLRFDARRLVAALLLPLAVVGGLATGLGKLDREMRGQRPPRWMALTLDPDLVSGLHVTVLRPGQVKQEPKRKDSSLARVRREGVLRVGYSATVIPFCYWNQRGDLVGYDVMMAYQLAHDLGVNLELVPFEWNSMMSDLEARRFDVAMSGVYVTPDRLRSLGVSTPYYHSPWALIVPTEQAASLTSRDKLGDSPVTVFQDQVMIDLARDTFPYSPRVVVESYESLVNEPDPAPAIWTLDQASAFASVHRRFTAVRPQGMGDPALFAYMTPAHSELQTFLEYWMQQKDLEGFSEQERGYWLQGRPRADGT